MIVKRLSDPDGTAPAGDRARPAKSGQNPDVEERWYPLPDVARGQWTFGLFERGDAVRKVAGFTALVAAGCAGICAASAATLANSYVQFPGVAPSYQATHWTPTDTDSLMVSAGADAVGGASGHLANQRSASNTQSAIAVVSTMLAPTASNVDVVSNVASAMDVGAAPASAASALAIFSDGRRAVLRVNRAWR